MLEKKTLLIKMDFDTGFFSNALQVFYAVRLNDGLTQNSTLSSKVCGIGPPQRCGCNLKWVIFKLISNMDILSTTYGTVLMWMPQYLSAD